MTQYDDTNELIKMERRVSGDDDDNADNPDQWSKWCEAYKLPQPMQIEEFNKIDWDHVSKYDDTCLELGSKFLSKEELVSITRRHPHFKMCRPGPVNGIDEFYVDSIVQEVQLIRSRQRHYVVRWVGYPDEFNTVETKKTLEDTAIWVLHTRQDIFTASRSNGPTLLRRSIRNIRRSSTMTSWTEPFNSMCNLNEHLKAEQFMGRYLPQIGFYSLVFEFFSQLQSSTNDFSFL